MNIKKYLSLAGLLFPMGMMAQTDSLLCDFETAESYAKVGVYDTWEHSPFRDNRLKGNAKVTANPYTEVDDILGFAPNKSAKVLGAQRSRFGSNTFGAMVTLKKPFELKNKVRYVHVKIWTPSDSRVMLIGLGRRTDRPWQPTTTEQFWQTSTAKVQPGKWCDAVFPVSGANGIEIHNLLVVPDLKSTHDLKQDFLFYVDDIIIDDNSTPRFSSVYYGINFDEDQSIKNNDRLLNSVTFKPASQAEATVVPVNQGVTRKLYNKVLDQVLTAKPGEKVQVGFNWKGNAMSGYFYLDTNQNGRFDVAVDGEQVKPGSEVLSYSHFKGKNSAGQSANAGLNMPEFTVPDTLKPGVYRVRYKVDWDCVDPGGNTAADNTIYNNRGAFADMRLVVYTDNQQVTVKRGTRPNGGGLNGDVLKVDGSDFAQEKIPFGKDYKVRLRPAPNFKFSHMIINHGNLASTDSLVFDTPQYMEHMAVARELDADSCYTIPAKYIDGDVELIPFFKSTDGQVQGKDYPINFSEDLAISRTDRRLNRVKFTATKGGTSTLVVPHSGKELVFRNLTGEEVSAVPGDEIATEITYQGGPMHAYLYLDLDQDGHFDYTLNADGTPSPSGELFAYSFFNNKNSQGASVQPSAGLAVPNFTLPKNLRYGNYRARLKVDWANIDPAGQWTEGGKENQIEANGGYVVDFILNVHPETSKLDIRTTNGSIVGKSNKGLPTEVPYGRALNTLLVPAADGYKPGKLTVRHGHNLDGAQYIHGNRQWSEYTTNDTKVHIVKADSVNGEVRMTVDFEPTAEADYKLMMADEFNTANGSMPDSKYWSRSEVGHGITWKRFVAQTEEGQQQTGYMEDGKLVMLCKPNTLAAEKDDKGQQQAMISGAIESKDKFDFTYGKIEARILTTPHTGNFPAFWMMPTKTVKGWPKDGEIDIWEQIDDKDNSFHTIHSEWANSEAGCHGQANNPKKSSTISCESTQYHTFGLEWEEDKLSWYVDGRKVFSYAKSTDADALAKGQWPFDKHFYIILNQSVGNGSWAKPADTNFTYRTEFDWVRVYQKEGQVNTEIGQATDADANMDVYVRNGKIIVVAPQETLVTVCDVQGRTIYREKVQGNVSIPLTKGVYVLNGRKVMVP